MITSENGCGLKVAPSPRLPRVLLEVHADALGHVYVEARLLPAQARQLAQELIEAADKVDPARDPARKCTDCRYYSAGASENGEPVFYQGVPLYWSKNLDADSPIDIAHIRPCEPMSLTWAKDCPAFEADAPPENTP